VTANLLKFKVCTFYLRVKSLSRKILIATLLVSLAAMLGIGIVFAQTEIPTEGQSILYVVGAWLIYSIVGLLPALIEGQKFDAFKFTRSFIWAIIVAILAIGFSIHPTIVEAEYTNLVTELVNVVGNSGFGLSLIYFFDKLYRVITGLASKMKVTAEAAK